MSTVDQYALRHYGNSKSSPLLLYNEGVDNTGEKILNQILARFEPEREAETNEEEVIVKPVPIDKAVAAVNQLC